MILLVTGSRSIGNRMSAQIVVWKVLNQMVAEDEVEVLHQGGAGDGVDLHARRWAWKRGIQLANWEANFVHYGPAGGPIRNEMMVLFSHATQGIAIWDGRSTGTKGCIDMMARYEVPHRVYDITGDEYELYR